MKKSLYRQELEVGKLHEKADRTSNEITALHADISEILHRLDALEAGIGLSKVDPDHLQNTLQDMLDKIKLIADGRGVELKF